MTTPVQMLTDAITSEGVTHVFGISGGPIVPLTAGLSKNTSLKMVLARHEQGAAMMADGYARVKRRPGVCCITSGPGATNALSGVAGAQADSIPLLVITGQVSTSVFAKGALQDGSGGWRGLDIVDTYRSSTLFSSMLVCAEQMPQLLRHALCAALSGRQGAAHINLPANIMQHETDAIYTPQQHDFSAYAVEHRQLERATEALVNARRPVILAGHGVNLSGAWGELERFACHYSIPVATTLKGKGAFPENHPLSLGVFGLNVSPRADEYVLSAQTDLLIVIGSSLGEFQTNSWDPKLADSRELIQIDIDEREIGKNYPTDIALQGDANTILNQLLATAPASPVHREKIPGPKTTSARDIQGDAPQLRPQALTTHLSQRMDDDTLLFVDAGNCFSWAGEYWQVRACGNVHIPLGLGCMGFSIPASIGGKFAAPHRSVVALVGDAAFMMTGMEVHTAVEHNLHIIWVVLNNGGHGMVSNGENMLYGKSIFSEFSQRINIAGLAEAMGAGARKVSTLDEFEAALEDALNADGPFLIDAHVDMDEVPPVLKRRIATLSKYFTGKEK